MFERGLGTIVREEPSRVVQEMSRREIGSVVKWKVLEA